MKKKGWLGISLVGFFLIAFSYLYLSGFSKTLPPHDIFMIRLTRFLITFVAGFVLAISGASLQTILQNPLADPYLLGISSGALLGVAISKILPLNIHLAISIPGFTFSILTVLAVYHLSKVRGILVKELMILGGLFINFFFSGLVFYLLVIKKEILSQILYTLWGYTGVVVTSSEFVLLLLTLFLAFLISLLTLLKLRELDALTLGDHEALSLGIDVNKVRNYVFFTVSWATALVVSVTGAIGFVGLMVPNIVRKTIGAKHAVYLPLSGFTGALLLLLADVISRKVSPVELPLSIILGIFAVPFFFWIIWRARYESDRS